MTSSKPNALELAKQGNPKAIEALINRQLQPKGILAKVKFESGCLKILLESDKEIPEENLCTYLKNGIKKLKINSVQKLIIQARNLETQDIEWIGRIEIDQENALSIEETGKSGKLDVEHSSVLNEEKLSDRDLSHVEYLRSINVSEKRISDSLNPNTPYFGCLAYWLWIAFGFCLFTSVICFTQGQLSTAIKLSVLSVLSFPPLYSTIGKYASQIVPDKRLFKKGIRDLSYLFSFVIFGIFSVVSISMTNFGKSDDPSKATSESDTPIQESIENESTVPSSERSLDSLEKPEQDTFDNAQETPNCEDRLIAQGASVEKIVEICIQTDEEITPLTQEEVEIMLCDGVKGNPSDPWYLECAEKGYL